MLSPTATGERRLPALDGLRALAVGLVLAYHGGIAGPRVGGFYGVDVFFVLSGFLITRLLLAEQAGQGRLRLALFWSRRARRLLPALLVMLAAVEGYVVYLAPPGRYPGFRGDALSVIAYWSNWHLIAASSNYFTASGWPSLLTHTWSLAIEEQFYLVWPLLLWGAARLARRHRSDPARLVLTVSAAGSLASAVWMAWLYRSGADLSRLYYGTDTHAQGLLVGCALAALTRLVPIRLGPRAATWAAAAAAAALGWATCSLGSADPVSYQGGFLLVSLLAATLVAVVVAAPSSAPARVLSSAVLSYIGRISYGMYLWYFPLFAALDRASTGLSGGALFVVRCAADVAAAAVSFHLIEQPIRAWRPRPRAPRGVPAGTGTLAMGAGAAGLAVALVLAGTRPSGVVTVPIASAVATPTGTGAGGTRILVFGDSTAVTLGDDLAFSKDATRHRIVLDVAGTLGCGLVVSAAVTLHGQRTVPPTACRVGAPSGDGWPAQLRTAMAAFHPDVVLVATGRWEVESRQATPGGPWLDITDGRDASYVRSQLERAASIVVAGGARVALATAPCFSSGEQPNGDPWPEDSPTRLEAYNALIRQVAAQQSSARPGTAGVVDLDSMVCPGGAFHTTVDGVTVRSPDGIHYPFFVYSDPKSNSPADLARAERFGAWIEPKILQEALSGCHCGAWPAAR